MTRDDFYLVLDELLELEPGTLKGPEVLKDQENWDSLSIVTLMGISEQRFNVSLPAKGIAACRVVDDLYTLVESQPAA